MNFGENSIELFHESRKACLCGHQRRHHLGGDVPGAGCTACSCDRFCASIPPSFGEGDTDLLREIA